ncbi:sulfide-dependent adenosine diphosphate thiazole synthase [Methanoplanus endosymbiosus]|uniref:Thiamine thiazole synthase n=1 Tax=Methanoplanus endosymbiosus TaxID=33865 RepID=A0A9E7PJS2_9EURY|nr:sulfide-dependent adenosine diphosphate thiazole synthase [Methanoplanus endosymbiosus]UUX91235.1 sulfide-dependent adenosine diphosphate thiazole synthase [Methanoplanus endosymbiosus]
MKLDEVTISRAIVSEQSRIMLDYYDLDCAIVGAGPSGLTCAALLGEEGLKVGVIEKKLSVGGGMWGGGMMFPRIVVQEEARRLLDHFDIKYKEYESGYFVSSSVEAVAKITSAACDAGAEFFNLTYVEDVVIKGDNRVSGLVINQTPIQMTGLHIDPLTLATKVTIDATGHDSVVAHLVRDKGGSVDIKGEGFMWADRAESNILSHTKEIFPGLIVTGMAANAVGGERRMGPVFGGMLLSGEKAAKLAKAMLKK